MVLWINSTLGLASVLLSRVPTEGPWLQLKKPALESMIVLDVTKLTDTQLNQLSAAFDQVTSLGLGPFRNMSNDPTRKQIDDALASTLGISGLDRLRTMLGYEAIVTGKPMLKARADTSIAGDQHDPLQLSLELI